ncbi:hypothetical protein ACFV0T_16935 [Streptomyces sp. NPDC059582]|uniref:hypothetical protein n=1 Tax=Streptomyces sp. NPDC059582 TaxID=3346875 RepID=UPI0036CC69EA
MGHHHKSNRAVEGNPDYGRGRGMPLRPDQDELERRTERDRRDVDLAAGTPPDPQAVYWAEQNEIDREADSGELPTGKVTRRARDPFPPTRYQG